MILERETFDLRRAIPVRLGKVVEVGRTQEDDLRPIYTTVTILDHPNFQIIGDGRNNHDLTILKRGDLAQRFHDLPGVSVELVDDDFIKVTVQKSSHRPESSIQMHKLDTYQKAYELEEVILDYENGKEYSVLLPLNTDSQHHIGLVLSVGDERIALLSFDQATMGLRYGGEEKENYVGLIFSPFLFTNDTMHLR